MMTGRVAVVCLWLFTSTSPADAETLSRPHHERVAVMRKAAASQVAEQEEATDDDDEPTNGNSQVQEGSEVEEDEVDTSTTKKGKKEEDSSTEEDAEEDAETESALLEEDDGTEASAENDDEYEEDLRESDDGQATEFDDIHYVAQKSLAKLKEMHKHGKATKDEVLALISDSLEQTLGDNEMMVPVRIQGFTGHFPDALKTMAPEAFLEKLVNGLSVPAVHKPMTVAQLAADTEHEARAGDDGDQGEEKDHGEESDHGESEVEQEEEGEDDGEDSDQSEP